MILQARNRALVLAPQVILEACVRDGRSDLVRKKFEMGLILQA